MLQTIIYIIFCYYFIFMCKMFIFIIMNVMFGLFLELVFIFYNFWFFIFIKMIKCHDNVEYYKMGYHYHYYYVMKIYFNYFM